MCVCVWRATLFILVAANFKLPVNAVILQSCVAHGADVGARLESCLSRQDVEINMQTLMWCHSSAECGSSLCSDWGVSFISSFKSAVLCSLVCTSQTAWCSFTHTHTHSHSHIEDWIRLPGSSLVNFTDTLQSLHLTFACSTDCGIIILTA